MANFFFFFFTDFFHYFPPLSNAVYFSHLVAVSYYCHNLKQNGSTVSIMPLQWTNGDKEGVHLSVTVLHSNLSQPICVEFSINWKPEIQHTCHHAATTHRETQALKMVQEWAAKAPLWSCSHGAELVKQCGSGQMEVSVCVCCVCVHISVGSQMAEKRAWRACASAGGMLTAQQSSINHYR